MHAIAYIATFLKRNIQNLVGVSSKRHRWPVVVFYSLVFFMLCNGLNHQVELFVIYMLLPFTSLIHLSILLYAYVIKNKK